MPLGKIERFVKNVQNRLTQYDDSLRANCYGHIGDGNIHISVFSAEGYEKNRGTIARPDIAASITQIINEETVACGGSISAEHGIGRMRTNMLQRYGDPVKLALMRSIKRALDPKGILNPGALL